MEFNLSQTKCKDINALEMPVYLSLTSQDTIINDNTVYNAEEISSISISAPQSANIGFYSEIIFTSGHTPTTFSAPTFKWTGDNIVSGVFVPASDTRYNISIFYDGIYFIGVVLGIAI